jgi:hypothetical protein
MTDPVLLLLAACCVAGVAVFVAFAIAILQALGL